MFCNVGTDDVYEAGTADSMDRCSWRSDFEDGKVFEKFFESLTVSHHRCGGVYRHLQNI